MKIRFVNSLLILLLLIPFVCNAQNGTEAATLQSAASSGNGTDLSVGGLGLVGVSILGTAGSDRVVTFYVSQDGTNFATVSCRNSSSLAVATTITTSGTTLVHVTCPVGGMRKFRAALSGGATGTVTVKALAIPNVSFNSVNGETLTLAGLSVDSPTFVIDATNNYVGVGTATPTFPLHVVYALTTPTATTAAIRATNTVTLSTNNANVHIGLYGATSVDQATFNLTTTQGIRGADITASAVGASGTVSDVVGVRSAVNNTGAGILTTAVAFYAVPANSGGGTFTNYYGYFQPATTIGSTIGAGFRSSIGVGSSRYNAYFDGAAQNYFAGFTAIGPQTAPVTRLQVTAGQIVIDDTAGEFATSKFNSQGVAWSAFGTSALYPSIILNSDATVRPEIAFIRGSRTYPEFAIRQHTTADTGGEIYVGPGTVAPTLLLTFTTSGIGIDGQANKALTMIRNVTADTAGNAFTLTASGATIGGTNRAGGDLILAAGLSTGSGISKIKLRVYPSTAASTSDNTAQDQVSISAAGIEFTTGVNAFNTALTVPLMYNSGSAGGAYPFLTAGNLVLQSRASGAERDIVFVTGTTAAVRMLVSNNGAIIVPPATQTIAATNTITADACGGVKNVTAASGITTNTTDTFTAPASTTIGCKMLVCNVGTTNAILLDKNSHFFTVGGADVSLAANSCLYVVNDGTQWRQASALLTAS